MTKKPDIEPDAEHQMDNVTVDRQLIAQALKCIDLAAERGAFKGGELSPVGSIRDTLAAHTRG